MTMYHTSSSRDSDKTDRVTLNSYRSCETSTKKLQSKQQTALLIMDFWKAFDKVGPNKLPRKFVIQGVTGTTNQWIASFLRNRKQSVGVKGEKWEYLEVLSGITIILRVKDEPIYLFKPLKLCIDLSFVYSAHPFFRNIVENQLLMNNARKQA